MEIGDWESPKNVKNEKCESCRRSSVTSLEAHYIQVRALLIECSLESTRWVYQRTFWEPYSDTLIPIQFSDSTVVYRGIGLARPAGTRKFQHVYITVRVTLLLGLHYCSKPFETNPTDTQAYICRKFLLVSRLIPTCQHLYGQGLLSSDRFLAKTTTSLILLHLTSTY